MPSTCKRSSIKFLCLVALSALCAFSRASGPRYPQEPIAADQISQAWVSTAFGPDYDVDVLFQRYPHLKRLYLPLYQHSPRLISAGLNAPVPYLTRLADVIKKCHARGVSVFGIFAPLYLDPAEAKSVKDSWLERGLQDSFSTKPHSILLSVYNDETVQFLAGVLDQCLKTSAVDGVVFDCNYPMTALFGYSPATREHFVHTIGIDPVDIDYPLGVSRTVKLKGEEWAEKIALDRLERYQILVKSLSDICRQNSKEYGVLGLLDLYEYPATTRAAILGDWANALITDPKAFAIVSLPSARGLTSEVLSQLNNLTSRLGIQSRMELLVPHRKDDLQVLSRFFEAKVGSAQGSLAGPMHVTILVTRQ